MKQIRNTRIGLVVTFYTSTGISLKMPGSRMNLGSFQLLISSRTGELEHVVSLIKAA